MYESSHMVSVDYPDASMDMFFRSIGIKNDLFMSRISVIIQF